VRSPLEAHYLGAVYFGTSNDPREEWSAEKDEKSGKVQRGMPDWGKNITNQAPTTPRKSTIHRWFKSLNKEDYKYLKEQS